MINENTAQCVGKGVYEEVFSNRFALNSQFNQLVGKYWINKDK